MNVIQLIGGPDSILVCRSVDEAWIWSGQKTIVFWNKWTLVGGGEVKNEEVLWTRPDPESVSRASSFTFHPKVDIEFWEWNNAQRKGKIRVWERERIKQREDDQEQTDRNRAREKVQAFRPCLLHAKHCTSVSLYRLCTWNEESMTLCGKSTLFKHVATLQNDCISKYMK